MSDPAATLPVRVEGLDINVMDDGFVVYQPSHDRVHYLNPTAGLLLELCNGALAEAELAERVRLAWNLPEAPHGDVAAGLQELRAQELIR